MKLIKLIGLIVTHSQNDKYIELVADNFVGIDFNPNYYVDISEFSSQFPVEIWNRFGMAKKTLMLRLTGLRRLSHFLTLETCCQNHLK